MGLPSDKSKSTAQPPEVDVDEVDATDATRRPDVRLLIWMEPGSEAAGRRVELAFACTQEHGGWQYGSGQAADVDGGRLTGPAGRRVDLDKYIEL